MLLTKSRWVRFMPGAKTRPVSSPLLASSVRKRLKPLTTKRKMRGDCGKPWRKPHLTLKKGDVAPFMSTTKEVVEMHPIIHLMKATSKLRWINNILTHNQLKQSYTFDKSILITTPNMFLAFRLCRASCATPMAS